jgi:hypothetical protein
VNLIINETSKEIILTDMVISNPDIYSFLCDKENKEEWIERALIIGCAGLKQMILTDNVDYVEKKFNDFLQEAKGLFHEQSDEVSRKIEDTFSLDKTTSPLYMLQSLILDYFDEDKGKFKRLADSYFDKEEGEIKKLLDQSFDLKNTDSAFSLLIKNIEEMTGKDEDTIKELLDPHKTDSPAEKLKKEIFIKFTELKEQEMKQLSDRIKEIREQELKDIRDVVLKSEAIEEEKKKGTAKGFEFEDVVYESLTEICSSFTDNVKAVGEAVGISSKKGDIIIDVDGDEKSRIVIECKDASNYTVKKTIEEINEAIANRNSAFGIFLFSSKDKMPGKFNSIKITDSYIITYMDNDNLHFAYRLARTFLKRSKAECSEIDTSTILIEAKRIEELVENINTMQTKVSQIVNSANYLRNELQKLYDGVHISINKIEYVVGKEIAANE